MRMARGHPVRVAALIGGAVGLAVAIGIEISGATNHNSSSVIRMLLPAAGYGAVNLSQAKLMQAVFILLIEIGANVLVYAAMFAAPVALVVLIRRAFSRPRARI
jgi:hypothetical protein